MLLKSIVFTTDLLLQGEISAKVRNFKRKEKIMKTFKQIAEQIERIERLYYDFGCGSTKMLERAEKFFSSRQNLGLCF